MSLESLEKEKKGFRDFLKSNLKLLVSLCIIFIFVGTIFLWLEYNEENKRIKSSENFIEAKILLTENNRSKSLEILKNIIKTRDKTYSPLSLFLIIDQKLEKDKTVIIKYFNEVLSIGSLENEDLNLLKLKKAIFVSNTSNEQDMLDLLNPIINSDSVWKIQSLKFLGDYYFSLKQFKKAEQYYSILLKSEDNSVDLKEIKRKMKSIQNG
tara:strand:- start:3722 stop:4351 length:630 start_codon:yes stop_codon:yes gene_type:complete